MNLTAISSPVAFSQPSQAPGMQDSKPCGSCAGQDSYAESDPFGAPENPNLSNKSNRLHSVQGVDGGAEEKTDSQTQGADPFGPRGVPGEPLTRQEQTAVRELRKRDQEVRAHEQAHIAAGAGVTRGGARYEFEKGPDGGLYAVGGEVSIDTSEAGTPEETVKKMERVKAAALAPANPSAQDRRVAAQAAAKAQQAQAEMATESRESVNAEQNPSGTVDESPDEELADTPASTTSAKAPEYSLPVGSHVHVVA